MSAKNFDKKLKKNLDFNNINREPEESESWMSNGLHRFIIVFSIAWFGIVAVYFTYFYGWSNLFSMVPNEFSGFMACVTLPMAIIWVIMAYIDRGNSFKNETRMLRNSLNQFIFSDANGDAASKMISDAIKSQVSELKDVTRDACAQADVIKRDLTERVADLRQLVSALDSYSAQTMQGLSDEINKMVESFTLIAEKAATATADFRVNTMQMRDDSEKLVDLLKPMVNEMVTAAERVQEVVNVNNANIEKAQSQLKNYSETSQLAVGKIIESWAEKGENLEKTFLRTAENCEDLFRRLDSGISHIESSVSEQKAVVDKQSDILDKNTVYLENKLGEYGKLISLEVEAMVERSGTLEQNLQVQMKGIRSAAEQTAAIFKNLGAEIADTRKVVDSEASITASSKNSTLVTLEQEKQRLKEFYTQAKNDNTEIENVMSVLAKHISNIEGGLNKTLYDFRETSTSIAGKLQEFNGNINENVNKLMTTSEAISTQGKVNAELLTEQDNYMNQSMLKLKQLASGIGELNADVAKTTDAVGSALSSYEKKLSDFRSQIDSHIKTVNDNYAKADEQIAKFKMANIDDFMQNSSAVIAELENLSIDITAIFNRKGDIDDLWKKYNAGDTEVFARYLAKNMTKKEVEKIRKDYEEKSDFRLIINKYLDDFDSLVNSAKNNARGSALLAMLSGSDIGKIYYIISRALGKIK
ncbi:MAG: hypothetical protein IJ564_01875 [Alphaproteobacteria bacterium]|nr:hypothetical protein [Alphaproteobacteria bacterium]